MKQKKAWGRNKSRQRKKEEEIKTDKAMWGQICPKW